MNRYTHGLCARCRALRRTLPQAAEEQHRDAHDQQDDQQAGEADGQQAGGEQGEHVPLFQGQVLLVRQFLPVLFGVTHQETSFLDDCSFADLWMSKR